MEFNTDALAAALKMAGQDTTDMDKMLHLLHAVETIQRDGMTPQAMMGLMAQYNPRYRAMSALLAALSRGSTPQPSTDKPDDGVQYNHP